jgi:pyridoxamine 5'-phosphate oxidase
MTRVAATRGRLSVHPDAVTENDPLAAVQSWLDEARAAVGEPHVMTVATATPDGRPSARVVLLRGLDERGLTFFTNRTSRKGDELRVNPRAAATIHWWKLGRQVRVEGLVEDLARDESLEYWETRPRGSQIAAWASPQSKALADRAALDALVAEVEARFSGREVPLPPFWGGYRLVPESIELWTHRDNRLHDRLRYIREGNGWRSELLAP